MAGFSDEDHTVIENLYVLKDMEQKKLSKEFLNKGWGLQGLEELFQKAARNWHDGRMKQQH